MSTSEYPLPDLDDELRACWLRRASRTGMSLWWAEGDLIRELWDRELRETDVRRRQHVLTLLLPLLESDQLLVGDIQNDGTISLWDGRPAAHLERIEREWHEGEGVGIGKICGLVGNDWSPTAIADEPEAILNPIDSAAMRVDWLETVDALDGHITLFSVADRVDGALGEARTPREIRDETLRLLWPLLDAGDLVPVSIDNERVPRVEAWPGTARDHLSRLASEWPIDVRIREGYPDVLFGYLVSPKGME